MILNIVLPLKEKRKQENKLNFSKTITSKYTKLRKQPRKLKTQIIVQCVCFVVVNLNLFIYLFILFLKYILHDADPHSSAHGVLRCKFK
jgi:hypothetical protein